MNGEHPMTETGWQADELDLLGRLVVRTRKADEGESFLLSADEMREEWGIECALPMLKRLERAGYAGRWGVSLRGADTWHATEAGARFFEARSLPAAPEGE